MADTFFESGLFSFTCKKAKLTSIKYIHLRSNFTKHLEVISKDVNNFEFF
jgi:hypothetical protein